MHILGQLHEVRGARRQARDGLSQPDTALPGIANKYLTANYNLPYPYKVDKLKFDLKPVGIAKAAAKK